MMLAMAAAIGIEYWSGWTLHWFIAFAAGVATYFLTAPRGDKSYVVTDLETGQTKVVESTPKKMGWDG